MRLFQICPDCNGEGSISVMQPTPALDEIEYNCDRCTDYMGMVEVTEPLYRIVQVRDHQYGEPVWDRSEIAAMIAAGALDAVNKDGGR